ncbi:MAG TPA: hypothetical protein VIU64_06785 [Polyangia bacterium]
MAGLTSLATLSVLVGLVAGALGCGEAAPGSNGPDAGTAQDGGDSRDTSDTPEASPDAGTACAPSAGISASPNSIGEAIALMNDLLAQGRPEVSIPCFVESLARPLGVLAVNSTLSAQPADGPHNPRIFLFTRNLVLSVVPAGRAAVLLELGEYVSPLRSIKAEIPFPRVAPVAPTAPFDRITGTYGTVCGACHHDELTAEGVYDLHAFVSNVVRPRDTDEVPLSAVEAEAAACNPAEEPARCAILKAVLDHGPLERQTFSPDAPTIYD